MTVHSPTRQQTVPSPRYRDYREVNWGWKQSILLDFKSRWSRVPGIETTKERGQGRPSTDENHLTFDIWHYFYCSWWYVRKITNCPLCTNTPATPLKYEVFICNKGDLYRWWNVLMVFQTWTAEKYHANIMMILNCKRTLIQICKKLLNAAQSSCRKTFKCYSLFC